MESENNSSIITLEDPANVTDVDPDAHIYKGTPDETAGNQGIQVIVSATKAGTLKIYQSINGTTWDYYDEFDYPGDDLVEGSYMVKRVNIVAKWFYVSFENTSVGTNDIRLQTLLLVYPASVLSSGSSSVDFTPIETVWERDQITEGETVTNTETTLFSVHSFGFSIDNRYLKIYDTVGTINPATDVPKITIAIIPNVPVDRYYMDRGIKFTNGIKLRVTRLPDPTDTNLGSSDDLLVTILYR